ncbi:hypothetical protein D7Y27_37470, partial [Corallococcus sp. AB004]
RGLMGVGLGPDLVVSEVKTPASTQPGRSFLVDVRVCNVGTEPWLQTFTVAVKSFPSRTLSGARSSVMTRSEPWSSEWL